SIEGRADDSTTLSNQPATYRIVSPQYFSVLRIPVREGRVFSQADAIGRPPVAIISEDMARQYWPGQSPLGRRIRAGQGPRSAVMTIVGVVGSVRPTVQLEITPQIYVSYLQQNEPNVNLLVRSSSGASIAAEALKRAVWEVDPSQPVFNIQPL